MGKFILLVFVGISFYLVYLVLTDNMRIDWGSTFYPPVATDTQITAYEGSCPSYGMYIKPLDIFVGTTDC